MDIRKILNHPTQEQQARLQELPWGGLLPEPPPRKNKMKCPTPHLAPMQDPPAPYQLGYHEEIGQIGQADRYWRNR